MNVISKMISIKYPRSLSPGEKSDIIEIYNKDDIKRMIGNQLFVEHHDYVLVSYASKYFICEKNSDTTYTRRDILYHPYIEQLN